MKFRILQAANLNVAWLIIEEGNINIETGIRFMYGLYDYDLQFAGILLLLCFIIIMLYYYYK
jgi:hypothetical protein